MDAGIAGSGASADQLPHNHREELFNSRTGKEDAASDQRADSGNQCRNLSQ